MCIIVGFSDCRFINFCVICFLAPACQNDVSVLHDMTRRLRTYRIIHSEPSVADHVIKEGWYNLQDFRMSNIADNAKLGDCGTYYPIVLNSE